MQLLSMTAEQIGFWGDKMIFVVGIAIVLGVFALVGAAKRSRRANTDRADELNADREADLQRSGPPRFNG